jgi:hypothetical protein
VRPAILGALREEAMRRHRFALVAVGLLAIALAAPAQAAGMRCTMSYTVSGWSVLYRQYRGTGTVTCDNGQTAAVRIVAHGGGITFGRSEIRGTGTFSEVYAMEEIFGTFVEATGHAGMTRSAEGRAMTKGTVSLALSGTGRGVDVGFAFGGFTIRPN